MENKEYKNINIKLHKEYDKDIIEYLKERRIKQTITKLIRKDIRETKNKEG